MPFEVGKSGNERGRPKFTSEQKEKRTEFQSLLKEATIPALQSIIEIASDKRSRDRLRACQYIIDKAYGVNAAFLSDDETEPIKIQIIRHNPDLGKAQDPDDSWD